MDTGPVCRTVCLFTHQRCWNRITQLGGRRSVCDNSTVQQLGLDPLPSAFASPTPSPRTTPASHAFVFFKFTVTMNSDTRIYAEMCGCNHTAQVSRRCRRRGENNTAGQREQELEKNRAYGDGKGSEGKGSKGRLCTLCA